MNFLAAQAATTSPDALNFSNRQTMTAHVEPSHAAVKSDDRASFERNNCFAKDRKDQATGKTSLDEFTGLKDAGAK